jgi:hypothetical protein
MNRAINRAVIISKALTFKVTELSVRSLCKSLGRTNPIFYKHFDSIVDLLQELIWYHPEIYSKDDLKYLEASLYINSFNQQNKQP